MFSNVHGSRLHGFCLTLSDGANIHYVNENQTALDLAVLNGAKPVIEYLVSLGASSAGSGRKETTGADTKVAADRAEVIAKQKKTDEEIADGNVSDEDSIARTSERWSSSGFEWGSQLRSEAQDNKKHGDELAAKDDFEGALKSYILGLDFCYPCRESRDVRASLHSCCSFVLLELKRYSEALVHAKRVRGQEML